ncbi:MAG: 6-pyruvoyl-tetrahydropterin synthase-related protein [Pyrinomonadaceae bacterium]
MSKLFTQKIFYIIVIGGLAILATVSMFYNGVPGGNDLPQHYQFAETFYHSILSGEIYPSLAGDPNQGYGDVGIRFYPPFAYYVLSAARIFTGNWADASFLTFFLIFFASGIGVYLWAKEEFSDAQSLLAAGIFIFAPHHLNQIYNSFLFAEFAASAVLPFCFLFTARVCRKGNLGAMLGLAISFALLLLTHLPTSVFGSPILAIYAIFLLRRKSFLKTLSKLAVSVFCGVAASSFYWLRMLAEMSWVKSSSETYFQGHFDYRENFLLFPFHLLNFQDDISSLWLADLMLLAMILISIPSVVFLIKNRSSVSKFSFSVGLIFLISVLMTTPLSYPVWDNLPFLQKVQFPWRLLGIVSLCGAIFSSTGIFRVAELMNQNKNRFAAAGLGLAMLFFVFTSAFIVRQASYVPRAEFNLQIENVTSANSFDCWWSIWAKSDAFQIKEKLVAENRAAEITKWNSTEKDFNVAAGQPSLARVAAFYYPRWQATVNGNPAKIEKADDGAILIALPPEASRVELSFVEPFFVKISNVVSALTWLIFLIVGTILLTGNFYKTRNPSKIL